MDGGGQACVQFGQGGVGLLGDEHDQAVAAFRGHLDGAAGVGLGGERAGFAAALDQPIDPGQTDIKSHRDLRRRHPAIARADDPLAEIH